MIEMLFVILLAVTGLLSYVTSVMCGKLWDEILLFKVRLRLMVWCSAGLASIGFTGLLWSILILISYFLGMIPEYRVVVLFSNLSLGLFILLPLASCVLFMKLWLKFYRDKAWQNSVVPYAQFRNPKRITRPLSTWRYEDKEDSTDLAHNDDDKMGWGTILMTIVVVTLFGGVVLAGYIIQLNRNTLPKPTVS